MRIRLLAALLVPLLAAAPLRAQQPAISISTTYDASPRAVYRALIDVLEEQGFVVRARFLDAGVLTLPRLTRTPTADSLAAQLYFELEPKGDSTAISVQGRAVPMAERELRDDEQMSANAVVLQAQVEVTGKIGDAIKALPEHARNPEPREAGDEYGYGQGAGIAWEAAASSAPRTARRAGECWTPTRSPTKGCRTPCCCSWTCTRRRRAPCPRPPASPPRRPRRPERISLTRSRPGQQRSPHSVDSVDSV
jgi:hypothetical protein